MKENKDWFSVSKEGLKELQGTKPVWRLIGELVQNAFDEPITMCKLTMENNGNLTKVRVEDDSEIGFRDLKDAYTLFGWTYKGDDPEKRGRFNIGEKTLLSIAKRGKIKTTKGTIIFDEKGRTQLDEKTDRGTFVEIEIKATKKEISETVKQLKKFIVPKKVFFTVNGEYAYDWEQVKVFNAKLVTEVFDNENRIMKRSTRRTLVNLYKKLDSEDAILYEMGIPVQKIDCKFHVDVMQKFPLGLDRDKVLPSFLRDVYAEVLNNTINILDDSDVAEKWVREGASDDRVAPEVVKKIVKKRYGDKVCVKTVGDSEGEDRAITKGYRVLSGNELSKEEWEKIREADVIKSTNTIFGTGSGGFASAKVIPEEKWTKEQKLIVAYTKMIGRECLGKEISVSLVKCPKASNVADYQMGHVRFNVSKLPEWWWKQGICEKTSDLILHEIGHAGGKHFEEGYHKKLTMLGARLAMLALHNPEKFDIEVN